MEVEIKLRLPDAAAHRRLSSFLAPRLLRTDAPARPLAAATAAQRDVRLYGTDDRDPSRAVLTLKRRPRIDASVSRVEEVVEPLDPALALTFVDNPARLDAVDSPIVRLVSDEYGVGRDKAPFVCLGGFRNTRCVCELEEGEGQGLVLDGSGLGLRWRCRHSSPPTSGGGGGTGRSGPDLRRRQWGPSPPSSGGGGAGRSGPGLHRRWRRRDPSPPSSSGGLGHGGLGRKDGFLWGIRLLASVPRLASGMHMPIRSFLLMVSDADAAAVIPRTAEGTELLYATVRHTM
ncbi:uncharacterized protein [Aegilops tauschii subsp. strangulata]|uniref:uncharacterized protein n=1 Tax=Aegilops tauschii subsp. strangulata TaxID=200361 RepID=UPI003CC8BBD7